MFIETETTPNPAVLKFLPGREVMGAEGTLSFTDADQAARSPLAERLFDIPHVSAVFLGRDFVTVTKDADVEWVEVKPAILGIIMEHFAAGRPILRAEGQKQSAILEAEGRREAAFRDAEARERLAQAEASATRAVSEAIAGGNIAAINYFVAQKYVEAFGKLAQSPSQKLVMIPIEATGVLGSLAGITELARDAAAVRRAAGPWEARPEGGA